MALWGGRFKSGPDSRFKDFNDSLKFDYKLALEDIEGSIAWANAICNANIISNEEKEQLISALNILKQEFSEDIEHIKHESDEDIHSYVERRLIEQLGSLGKKLHTGRSRNDQVALDLKLWSRKACLEIIEHIDSLQKVLLNKAILYQSKIFPGYTHLQRAQPVSFTHYLLAYMQMFLRDRKRFENAYDLMQTCPLGSGALAGSAYKINRQILALELGFSMPTLNSLDAVADRDHVVEMLNAMSISMVHLSRLAEDLIIYNSGEFNLIELSDNVTSGSSLMPQKKNPDALELIRGKTGRIIGSLNSILVTLKGLPLAYNKDMQEDKELLFMAFEQYVACLDMMSLVIEGLSLNEQAAIDAAQGGYSNATELADYLVSKGVPFRDAHELVGKCVLYAIEHNLQLEQLSLSEFKKLCNLIEDDVYAILSLKSALEKRDLTGGVNPAQSASEIERFKKILNL